MQSSSKRRRLLKMMHAEPASVWKALAKCAAGPAVVALIAIIGCSERADHEVARSPVAPLLRWQASGRVSIANNYLTKGVSVFRTVTNSAALRAKRWKLSCRSCNGNRALWRARDRPLWIAAPLTPRAGVEF